MYKDNQIYDLESSTDIYIPEPVDGGWVGTPVPNSGYVENVYINTELSINEVLDILVNANLSFTDGMHGVITDGVNGLGISNDGDSFVILTLNMDYLFYYSPINESVFRDSYGWYGWNPDIVTLIINNNVLDSFNDFSFGSQNDKLSTLFSVTPFEYIESSLGTPEINYSDSLLIPHTIYTGEYKENIIYFESSPINIDTKNIYFAYKKSVDDVLTILKTITTSSDVDLFAINGDSNTSYIRYITNDYYYIKINDEFIFSSIPLDFAQENGLTEIDFVGWNPLYIDKPISVEITEVYDVMNDLSCLFSSTPFYKSEIVEIVETSYYSLFDLSMIHTTDTFNPFIWNVLDSSFSSIFNLISLDCSSYICKFIIVLLSWFVELSIIHVIVDLFKLIPDMFHNLRERWNY